MSKVLFEIFVHEEDVTKLIKKVQETLPAWRWDTVSTGWCGWANAMDCWWFRVPLKRKERKVFVDWILENVEPINEHLIY